MNQTDLDETRSKQQATKRKIVFWIAVGILVWGIVLAVGDFLANHDRRRPAIIVSSVVIFVGFWLLMLRTRGPNDDTPKLPPDDDSPDSLE